MFVFQSPPKGGELTEGCKDTASASEPSSQETTPEKSKCTWLLFQLHKKIKEKNMLAMMLNFF